MLDTVADRPALDVPVMNVAELTRRLKEPRDAFAAAVDDLNQQIVRAAETDGEVDFGGLVKLTQDVLGLDDLALSQMLKVSRPTIGRYVRNVSAPHAIMRRAMLNVLAKKTRAFARSLRD